MSSRDSKVKRLLRQRRDALKEKRLAQTAARKAKRKAQDAVQEIAQAVERSPAGREADENRKKKWGLARMQEQASHQKAEAMTSTRFGGRRKQIQAELRARIEG